MYRKIFLVKFLYVLFTYNSETIKQKKFHLKIYVFTVIVKF